MKKINFLKKLFHKNEPPTISYYDIRCPYNCGDEWRFGTTIKRNQVVPRKCPKCGKSYTVEIRDNSDNDFEIYVSPGGEKEE